MSHLKPNPSPPTETGPVTSGHEVDSSAIHLDAGVPGIEAVVELAEEPDRLQVLAAPVAVGDPGVATRVVAVQHRGHRVDPDPVGVEHLDPEVGARQQERPDLGAAVVEDRRPPIGVVADPPVGRLVEVGAVEVDQARLVHREVRRHPVEDHPDPVAVQLVDEVHQVLGDPVARGGGEVAGGLVAPRAEERVLHHRQQLDVGVALLEHPLDQRLGDDPVAGGAPPRPQVDLVDRDRRLVALPLTPAGHPVAVAPLIAEVPGDRGRPSALLGVEPDRVGLGHRPAETPDAVLVGGSLADAVDPGLPHPATGRLHRIGVAPRVPIADDGGVVGVGGPHPEGGAVLVEVAAEHLVEPLVGSLLEQPGVLLVHGVSSS